MAQNLNMTFNLYIDTATLVLSALAFFQARASPVADASDFVPSPSRIWPTGLLRSELELKGLEKVKLVSQEITLDPKHGISKVLAWKNDQSFRYLYGYVSATSSLGAEKAVVKICRTSGEKNYI
ncbi:hypothetical protein K438DRAFT_1979929 [Mycena galopus ATCC 62051]|nr:hypothetical protein K438DRAFT_1979929 [Mycena galopus ATCC 62051]